MKAKTAERLWLAAIALGAAAVLVFAPLVGGAAAADTSTGVAVVNLDAYPRIDKKALSDQLAGVDRDEIDRLIVISPPFADTSSLCLPPNLPALCEIGRPFFVPHGTNPIAALEALPHSDKKDHGRLVTTLRQGDGSGFGWWRAVQVGLLMTIIAAGSLYFSGLAIQRRRRDRAAVHGPAVPAFSAPVPGAGPPPVPPSAVAPPAATGRAQPATPAPAPARRRAPAPAPAPRPGPLPAEIAGAIRAGRRVVACTHFGGQGGYVDADGLLLWATPERPGEAIHPGRPLSVVGVGADAVIVSSRITEEVRR